MTGLPAGNYDIYVVLPAQPGGGSGAFTVHEHTFIVPNAASSLTATPASQSVTTAVPATVTSAGVARRGYRYLGAVDYGDG